MRSTRFFVAFLVGFMVLAMPSQSAQRKPIKGITPRIEALRKQPFVAIRAQASMDQLSTVIPAGIRQVASWLGAHGIHPDGPPFVRYLVIDMAHSLDIEIGFPLAEPAKATSPMISGAFPADRYVAYTYMGSYQGLVGVVAGVLKWASKNAVPLDQRPSKQGTVWGGRIEYYLTDPAHEPDPNKNKTKLLFQLANESSPNSRRRGRFEP